MAEKPPALAGFTELPELGRRPYVTGFLGVGVRRIPVVSTRLTAADTLGGVRARWGVGRDCYRVLPGLYAVGVPNAGSPVMVSANYKLSFDSLRRELGGIDAWILVLDTRGVNVWCAAGKGTFGTRELLDKITALRLDEVAFRPRLILPQLGAPGVSAPEVRRATGFRVTWGPVRASDIPAFLAREMRKDEGMSRVRFGLGERMAVAPVELAHAWPWVLGMVAASALLALPLGPGYAGRGLRLLLPFLGSLLVGGLLFPALLPWVPFRAFGLKGAVLGAAWGVGASFAVGAGLLGGAALTLAVAPVTAFVAMNFTGSSTFTSLTGAESEVRRGLPPMGVSLAAGVVLLVVNRLVGGI
jgi:hypothetical protein